MPKYVLYSVRNRTKKHSKHPLFVLLYKQIFIKHQERNNATKLQIRKRHDTFAVLSKN